MAPRAAALPELATGHADGMSVGTVTALYIELQRAWHRTWGWRPMSGFLLVAVLLVPAVWISVPVPAGAVHAELTRMRSANEMIGLALTVLAILSTYRLFTPDIAEGFESLSLSGGSRTLTFAAGRAVVGAGGLFVTAAALGIVVEALDVHGRYQGEEAVRVAVLFANAIALFMLAMVLTCAFGRVIGLFAAWFLQTLGSDAAYQAGAVTDGFIPPNPLVSFEQLLSWLAPPPVVDPLFGIALMDQSVALNQFPVRQGHAVWGTDLIQVSGLGDVIHYSVYLVVLAALLYFACWRRARHARTREHPKVGRLGIPTVGHDVDDRK